MPSPRNSWPAPMRSCSTSALKVRSAMSVSDERQHAQRAAGAVLDLERRRDDDRAGGGKLVEIGEALQPIAAGAMKQRVRRILRFEQMRLAGIGADGFGAETVRVTLLDQEAHRFRRRSRRMRAVAAA